MNDIIEPNYNLTFRHSFVEQKNWLENLSSGELKKWLRNFIWNEEIFPLVIPNISDSLAHLSDLLQRCNSQSKVKVRVILPELLKEWGRNDTGEQLRKLLILCGRLRAADAESIIIHILNDRLGHFKDEEIHVLRRNSLSVLSGFGCTENTVDLFKKYISEISYTPICYMALYRFRILYAATYLPTLLKIYDTNAILEDLRDIIEILFDLRLKENTELSRFWLEVLTYTHIEDLYQVIDTLYKIGIVFEPISEYTIKPDSNEGFYVSYNRDKDWVKDDNYVEIKSYSEKLKQAVSVINKWQEDNAPKMMKYRWATA